MTKTVCAICGKIIYASPNKGKSAGKVKIGGQLVSVHLECYYGKKERA